MKLVRLCLLLSGLLAFSTLAQNYALTWHPPTVDGPPTNCIANWAPIGTRTNAPGWDFVTNGNGLRFYVLHSQTNFVNWQSNKTFLAKSNRTFWTTQHDLQLSNIVWYSTNVNTLNASLAASNMFMLRATEERLK